MNDMIVNPDDYFRQWTPPRSDLLKAMEEEARQDDIPIVGPVVGKLLYLLVIMKGPRHIVELGTASGYSAIFMGEACRDTNNRLTTFEADPDMAAWATSNIEQAGLSEWVTVDCADALEGLAGLESDVDMVFMDIEKEDYMRALPLCKEKLSPNGLLVADNTGFQDAHEFNQAIFDDPEWEMVNLWTYLPGHSPENDGICIALKTI